jgi:replicative DNA helicase
MTFTEYEERPEALPPHNEEAESAVLGSVLLDRDLIGPLSEILDERDFYVGRHAAIYGAMIELYERDAPVDYLTLIDELDRSGRMTEAGGTTSVAGLIGAVPTPIHALYYAEMVARLAVMRRLISAGGKIATIGYRAEGETTDALERSVAIIQEITPTRRDQGPVSMEDGLADFLSEIQNAHGDEENELQGLTTGLIDLDKILGGGMHRSDLLILAARPAMGKTSAALHIMTALTTGAHHGALMFSLEMPFSQLLGRMLSSLSGVEGQRLRKGDYTDVEVRKIGAAVNVMADLKIWVDDSPDLTMTQIRERARRLHAASPLSLIVLDHVQLVTGGAGRGRRDENRVQEMSDITRGLKAMARELRVPVLALSQLNRAVEQRQNKVPILADLRESGSIEADADVVMFLYREDYYVKDSERQGVVEIHVAKHRNGPTGQVSVLFNQRTTRYLDLELSY